MKKRYTLIIVALFLSSLKGWAQLDIGMQNSQPVIPSWENYEMMKYGKIGASMYTGTVNYSIPIYTYKDKDFEIPISIDYATNGFRVNHSSGILGHGWSLYTPGVITRQVRGIPDERTMELCHVIANYPTADYLGYSNLLPSAVYTGEVMISATGKPYMAKFSNNGNHISTLYEVKRCYETNPDLFTFNFCGYTGAFARNFNNAIINGSKFKVFETEGLSRGLKVEMNDINNHITITTPDGYRYSFVSNEVQNVIENPELMTNYQLITNWVLDGITAPNGHSVTFEYEHNVLNKDSNANVSYTYHPRTNHYYMQCPGLYTINTSTESIIDSTITYTTRLKRINFSDSVRMEFSYVAGESDMSTGRNYIRRPALCDQARLSEVRLLSGNDVLKSCHFRYETNSSTSPYSNTITFLKEVKISGIGSYHFDYNQEDSDYPCLGTTKYDHWGYYNGQGFPLSGYMTYIHQDSTTFDEWITGGVKDPSPTYCSRGTLSKITYPTGGYSLLEYEPHTFSRSMQRNSTSFFEPSLVCCGEDKTAGGVRIKSIVTKLSPALPIDTVFYEYNRADSTDLSSGILLNTPRYGITYTCGGFRAKIAKFYDLSNQIFNYNRTHIEYTDVRARKSDGWTDYHYTSSASDTCLDFIENELGEMGMDMFTDNSVPTAGINASGSLDHCVYQSDHLVTMLLSPVTSMQFRRGKLERVSEYSSTGIKQRETYNEYSFPTLGNDTIYQVAGEVMVRYGVPMHSLELTSTTTTEYNGTDSLSKTEQYEYNRIGLPIVVKSSTSQGDTVVTRNTYVVDTVASTPTLNDPIIIDMADNHLLGKLLSSETHRVSGTTDRLLSAARLTYYRPAQNKPKLFCPSTKQEWVSGNNWKTTGQYQFDAMGNLVEVVDEASLTNSYLWSYGSRHMVSTLQNATKAQTETALASVGLHSVDSLARMTYLTSSDFGKVKDLGQQLGSSLQSAWRYRPLVGMTESAPPNHAGATYHYDSYGRLSEIRDDMGKVVGQQEYNIVSVLPMTSILHRDSLHLNDGVVAASVTAQGGSGSYSYQWQLADSTGAVLQTGTGSQMSQNLLPGNYTLTFTVTDMVSGESATHTWLAAVPVRFTNISDPVVENGWTTVTASITLGAASNVEFTVEYDAPSTFKVTIGNQEYNYSGTGLTSIQKSLSAGTTAVSISMYNASQGEATLSLTSVGNLAIGLPCALSFGGLSKKNNQQ